MTPSFPRDGVSGKPGVVQRSVSTTGKTSPESAKPRTGSKKPFNAASPSHSWRRPSPSCGTPPTPTPKTQIADRRRKAPWYTTKTEPSTMDMLYALRDTLTTHRINTTTPGHATPEQNPNQQVSPERVAS